MVSETMLFKDLLYFFVLSLLSRKSDYPQTRKHVMPMGPGGSPSPRQASFLWCLFPRFSPGQPPAGPPSSQKLPHRTRIKVRLSSTESEMWWEMWVEMVVHSALCPATWDITWHCSVKQNLKPQIIVWFKFPDATQQKRIQLKLQWASCTLPKLTRAYSRIA